MGGLGGLKGAGPGQRQLGRRAQRQVHCTHTGNVTIVSLYGLNSRGSIVLSASISDCSILMLFSPLYLRYNTQKTFSSVTNTSTGMATPGRGRGRAWGEECGVPGLRTSSLCSKHIGVHVNAEGKQCLEIYIRGPCQDSLLFVYPARLLSQVLT